MSFIGNMSLSRSSLEVDLTDRLGLGTFGIVFSGKYKVILYIIIWLNWNWFLLNKFNKFIINFSFFFFFASFFPQGIGKVAVKVQ